MTEASTEAVVVFGASGFIGRNIVEALSGRVQTLVGVTNQTPAVPGCELTLTLDHTADVPALPEDTVVINVAAHRYDATSFGPEQSTILSRNSRIATSVYEFCVARGISEVRLASSVAVYPADWEVLDDTRPLDLNAQPYASEMAYAWSKRWAEICADIYRERYGINTLTFRLTNPYGPYDSTDVDRAHVAAAFVLKALSSSPTFEIRGNPKGERDFVYAADVARVFAESLARRGYHEFFNVTYGETTSIETLAQAILEAADADKEIVVCCGNPGSVAVRRPTGGKLRKAFDLPRFTSLPEGLQATIQWYRNELGR